MECTDCRLFSDTSHHDHDGLCCDCLEERRGNSRNTPRPIVKSAALLLRDKKLLVVRTQGVKWFYAVGGKVEPGETDVECLRREVEEEIGCQVTSEQFYHIFRGPNTDGSKSMVMPCFFVTLNKEPQPSSEIEELLWVDSSTDPGILGSMIRDHIVPALKKDGLIT